MDFFLFAIFASAIYYEAKILGKPDRLAWIYRMTDTKPTPRDAAGMVVMFGVFQVLYTFATIYGLWHLSYPLKIFPGLLLLVSLSSHMADRKARSLKLIRLDALLCFCINICIVTIMCIQHMPV